MAVAPRTRNSWVKSVRAFAWTHFPRDPRIAKGLWLLVIFGFGMILLSASLTPGRYQLKAGETVAADIVATRTIIDRAATDRARQTAAAQVPDQYEIDPQVTSDGEAKVALVFAAIRAAMNSPASYDARATTLAEQCSVYGVALDGSAIAAALGATPETINALETQLRSVVDLVMQSGVKREYLEAARAQAGSKIADLGLVAGESYLLRSISDVAIMANMQFNVTATQARREEAMAAVPAVEILKGQVVVKAGSLVTADQLSVLQDLGLLRDRPAWGALLGLALILLLMEGAVALYLYLFDRQVAESYRRLALLSLLVILTMVLAGAARPFNGFFVPVAAGTMLIAVLIDVPLATFMAFILGPFVGLLLGTDLRYAIVALAGGLGGVFAVSRLGQRSDLMRSGLVVGAANTLAIVAVDLLGGRGLFDLVTLKDAMWGAGNGIACAVLTIGCLPFLEDIFGVLTGVKLLELANPDQPLLRRLLMEAPGTYHHSIVVGNLAEAAVAEVGGNTALARVGSYYHDIGKARRPYFFVDNQFGGDNPHDKIAPSLSALIITSHVRDGVAMAEEVGIPREVIDLIQQHHGTSLVSYFYGRATEAGEPESVVEADFRYDGPRPETREAAILMLADACEAAVRSLTKATPGRIEGVVRKVIKDRLDDGQLENSPLTLQDLSRIADVFSRVLAGTFHRRVEYPDLGLRDLRAPRGRNGKAPAPGGKSGNGTGRNGNGNGGTRNGNGNGGARNGNGSGSAKNGNGNGAGKTGFGNGGERKVV